MWRLILKTLGDLPVHTFAMKHLSEYISARRLRGTRGQTIRRELQALRRGFVLLQIAPPEPWPSARTDKRLRSDPAKESQRGKTHDTAIVWQWLEELPQDAQDEALFIWLTGLRHEECKRVLPDWVRGAGEGSPVPAWLDLPAHATKTREARTVGLSTEALAIVQRRQKAPGIPVFSMRDHKRTFRSAAKRIGYIARITPRDLRHMHLTAGAWLTGDARAAMAAAGHRDLTMTQRYLHSTEHRTGEVARAVGELVGKAGPAKGLLAAESVAKSSSEMVGATRFELATPSSQSSGQDSFSKLQPRIDDEFSLYGTLHDASLQPFPVHGRQRAVGIAAQMAAVVAGAGAVSAGAEASDADATHAALAHLADLTEAAS